MLWLAVVAAHHSTLTEIHMHVTLIHAVSLQGPCIDQTAYHTNSCKFDKPHSEV